MRRQFILIFIASLFLAASLAGCKYADVPSSPQYGGYSDDSVVASIGSHRVTWAQYKMTFDPYKQYYSEMGMDITASEERLSGFQERTVDALLQPCVLAEQAIAAGFDKLSSQQQYELDAQIADNIAQLQASYAAQVAEDLSKDPSINAEDRLKEYIAAESYYYTGTDMSYDEYINWISTYFTEQYYIQLLKDSVIKDVALDDSAVQEYYDKALAADEATYSQRPELYKQTYETADIPPVFVPDGYSSMLIYSVPIDGLADNAEFAEICSKLESLEKEYGAAALGEDSPDPDVLSSIEKEYAEYSASKQAILQDVSAAAHAKMDPIYEQLCAGADMAALCDVSPRLISLSHQSENDWSPAIKSAFSRLSPGELSPIIFADNSLSVIYYIQDVVPGPKSLADAADAISQNLLTTARDEAWQAQIDVWMQDDSIVRNDELIYAMGK